MLLIFIGLVFVFFNFQFNGFDLLADFVGYFLVYGGLTKLQEEQNFLNAKPFTLFMIVLNFFYAVLGKWIPPVILVGMGFINIVLSLYILFMINSGVKEIERCSHFYMKADKLSSAWRLILMFTAGNALLTLLPFEMFDVMANMFSMAATVMQIIYLFHFISAKEAMDQVKEHRGE